MASTSRGAQFVRLHKVLKKHYNPVTPDTERPVLEHLLFACCLENARHGAAEEAFATLIEAFFDLNEIRVSTVRELSEVLARLPDAAAAASRLKRVLQTVFESTYSFDIDELRKSNLGPAVDRLKKIDGTTPFSVAYAVQSALGGHSIPTNAGVLQALYVVDLLTEKDVDAQVVPGLERAIAKSKGIEFGSMLHQLGADFAENPYAPALRAILLEINPDAKDRLPKRRSRKQREADAEKAAAQAKKQAEAAASEQKKIPAKHKGKTTTQKQEKAPAKKKPTTKTKAAPAEKKTTREKAKHSSENTTTKSPSARLSKRKPR